MDKKINFNLETQQTVIKSKLKNIDEFLSFWQDWRLAKPEKILKELKELSTIQSIGSSTRIEGSKLSDEEIKNLINDLEINKMQTRDEQEVFGYFEVLDLIFENYQEILLSESYIKQLHSILLKHSKKDTRHKGIYKTLSNKVVAKYPGGNSKVIFNTTEPYLVETEMQKLIQWTNHNLENNVLHPLIVIGAFVYEFLSIHPFQDGNGRLSRLLTTLLMMKTGFGFVKYISFEHVIEQRKKEYYQNLMECQKQRYSEKENIGIWVIFFLECIENMILKLQTKLHSTEAKISSSQEINPRRMKILNILSDSAGLKVSEIWSQLESGSSKETLKKDLAFLSKQGLINKLGQGRGTFYTYTPQ